MESINNTITYKQKEHQLSVDVTFKTNIEITPRIIEVSNAFGLGISEEKEFVVYDNFHIGFDNGDLTYITGDSGGGKSVLLQFIINHLIKEKISYINLDDTNPDPEEVLIESLGETTKEAIYYLSRMGLNDAFILLRKYKHLSDGQKYRYKLAKALSQKPSFIFIDEYCAKLDRITAKVISYNLQKTCRKLNIGAFVSTTHRDLIDDFNPNQLVDKKFMNEVELTYYTPESKSISFYDDVKIVPGTMDDYKKLAKYHYKNISSKFPYSKIFKAVYGKELIGVTVYCPPFLQTKGRAIKFGPIYNKMTTENVNQINKLFIRRARNIISPKYRGCSLGKKNVIDSMNMIKDKKYIEAINVMGNYVPVNEAAGMEKFEISHEMSPAHKKIDIWFKAREFDTNQFHNPSLLRKWCDELSLSDKEELKNLVKDILPHPKVGVTGKGSGKRLEVKRQQKIYEESTYEDIKEDVFSMIPKLYSGNTLYYVWENKNYKESTEQQTFE